MAIFIFEPGELIETVGLARSCLEISSTPDTVDHSPSDHVLNISVHEAELSHSAILGGPARVQICEPAGAWKEDALWNYAVSYHHPSASPNAPANAFVTLYPEGNPQGIVADDETVTVASRLINDLSALRSSLD